MGSINKMQADALADGFLDDIGSGSPGDLQPRETLSVLFQLVGSLVESAQDNLNDSNSNASGKLSKSIMAEEPVATGTTLQVDVSMLLYGEFINKGVRGVKSGSGTYAFKSEFPSKKMVKSISKYIKSSKKKIRSTNSNTISQNEKKHLSISELSSAYATARAIKQHGIKATNFMDKAITSTSLKAEEQLSSALRVDIINSLPDKL
jgi:hypothetical protein